MVTRSKLQPLRLAQGGGLVGHMFEVAPEDGEARVTVRFLAPLKTWRLPLEELTRVAITREVRRSDKSTYTVYPVRVHGSGEDVLSVRELRDFVGARKLAEQVARAAVLPLHDCTVEGEPSVREPEELDLSLRERLALRGEAPELPEAAPDDSVSWRLEQEGATILVNRPDLGTAFGAGALLGGPGIAITGVALISGLAGGYLPWVLLGGGALVGLGVLGFTRKLRQKARITASVDELTIRQPRVVGMERVRLSATEIEEIELDPQGVRIATDRRVVVVGRSLKPTVRRWLRDALCAVVG